ELFASGASSEIDEHARIEPRHLRSDPHEMRQIQIKSPIHISNEARMLRHRAAKRCERATEALLAERAGDGPRERSRHAGQRLAAVDVAPNGVGVSALGEAAPGDGTGLDDPCAIAIACELDVPRHGLEPLEALRNVRE